MSGDYQERSRKKDQKTAYERWVDRVTWTDADQFIIHKYDSADLYRAIQIRISPAGSPFKPGHTPGVDKHGKQSGGGGGGGGGIGGVNTNHEISKEANASTQNANQQQTPETHKEAFKQHNKAANEHIQQGVQAEGSQANNHFELAEKHKAVAAQHLDKYKELTGTKVAAFDKPATSDWHAIQGDQHAEKWTEQLTKTERAAVKEYVAGDYSKMNGGLRKNSGNLDALDPATRTYVENLDAALRKSQAVDTIHVERAVSGIPGVDWGKLKKGDTITDHGYMSTSAGGEFSPQNGYIQARFHITVPKGTPGAFIKNPKVKLQSEREFLLPRGTKLVIHGVDSSKGLHEVYASVSPNGI